MKAKTQTSENKNLNKCETSIKKNTELSFKTI